MAKAKRKKNTGSSNDWMSNVRTEGLGEYGTRAMGIYAEAVNLDRAVPDLIDGLKPVQRRILWSAHQMPNEFVKTARLVGHCFAPGTLVTLEGGAQLPIEKIVVGDVVETDTQPCPVVRLFEFDNRDLYEVVTDTGVVHATEDQVFYCVDVAGAEVERTPLTLSPGDRIIRRPSAGGFPKTTTVISVKKLPGKHRVYDFEVQDRHRFYANDFLVHNCIGRFHPHGDSSVAGAIETMMHANVPLLRGKGNWGTLIDSAAAMRYCFTGDTRVSTEKGLLKFDTLAKSSAIGDQDSVPYNIRVDTKTEPEKTSHMVNSGFQEIVKVRSASGYEVRCTPNEPFYVITPEGYRWIDAADLEPGDWLCLKRGTELKVKGSHTYSPVLARFLGYMVGDGYCNTSMPNTIGFNQVDDQVFADFMSSVRHTLGEFADRWTISKLQPNSYGKQEYNQFTLHCKEARQRLAKLGLAQGTSYDQKVPESVFQGSTEFMAAFLSALFEADGSVCQSGNSSSQVFLHSVSQRLLADVSLILRSQFGIFGKTTTDGGALRFIISGAENVHRFKKFIGFRSTRKNDKLVVNAEALDGISTAGSISDCIPFAKELGLGRNSRIRRNNFKQQVAAKTITGKAATLLNERDYYYDQVEAVTDEGEAQVWDLTVPGTHSFVANGFVVHNTNCMLSAYGQTMFDSNYIAKEVTMFVPNYDDTTVEPATLPALMPNVLMNGGEGIGVGTTTMLPTFTPESLLEILTRLLKGEKLKAQDFADTLVYNYRYGGVRVKSKANKVAWAEMFTTPRAKVEFTAKLNILRDDKAIEITDWPEGINIPKFIDKVRELKEVDQAYNHKGASGFRIELRRDHNYAQFDKLVEKVQKLATKRRSFRINVTHRQAQVTDGVVSYDTKYLSLSVPQLIVAWLRERLALEKRSLEYRIQRQKDAIAYSKLMIWASKNAGALIKCIRASMNPLKDLQKKFKLKEHEAQSILDLQLRKLSKLDQSAIEKKLKEQLAHMKELEGWLAKPRKKVLADTQMVFDAIAKDRKFEAAKSDKVAVV